MDPRHERLARNEALFRDVNERVRAIAAVHGDDDHIYEFYCECSNADCTFQLRATLAEYETVRAHATRFLVAAEHAMPEIETVVEKNPGYWVVQKYGAPGALVEELDPRD
ncbi:MAG: hypothetical protein M3R12_08115 [Actinomycetota bacterium]|nr:hypothetical protein [Actinomycetota bacterium]